MAVRGIRGATTIEENTKEEIIIKTSELLKSIIESNKLLQEDIISVIFTVTDDVSAEFPAVAARELGWTAISLLCTREMPVPGSLQSCIRVLMHVNSDKKQNEMSSIYLHEAKKLRPDLVNK